MGSSRREMTRRRPHGGADPHAREVMRWIGHACGGRLWMVAAGVLLQMVTAGNAVMFALFMRDAVDAAVAGDAEGFVGAATAFGIAILAQVLLLALVWWLREATLASIDNALRGRIFGDILEGDVAALSAQHTGDLMNRLTSDVAVVSGSVVQLPSTVASSAVRIVGAVTVMAMLDIRLATVFVVAGCCMGAASLPLRSRLKRLHRDVQETEGRSRSFMQEVLGNLLVVRVFGARSHMLEQQRQRLEDHRAARMRRVATSDLSATGLRLAMQAGFYLGFVWCGVGLLRGAISYGTLMAIVQLVGQLQQPFASFGGLFPRYAAMMASAERLMAMRPEDAAGAARRTDIDHEQVAGLASRLEAISFDDIGFSYGHGAVLRHVTARIPRGSFVAVTGRSGIGKSTLLMLLLGIRRPSAGTVALRFAAGRHGAPPAAMTPEQLPCGMFAYVPQGNALMSGTVREVVALADRAEDIDDARVRWACRMADATRFVEALPDGYRTLLGERGSGLSEGQMQRLSVARALYSGAPILLLDEATSALDVASERRMLQSIRELGDRTVLIVTHRCEVLDYCDQVIRLEEVDDGR